MTSLAVVDRVDARHPAYTAREPDWTLCRDLFDGTRAVQAKGNVYLPRHPREHLEDYARRLQGAEVYNGFKRTIKAAAGMVFAHPPKLSDDAPAAFRERWQNIDRRRTAGDVFARKAFTDALTTGIGGILVDFPNVRQRLGGRLPTLAETRALALRPYWTYYRAEDIWNWRLDTFDERTAFALLVLREPTRVATGRFGAELRMRYRVFERIGDTVQFELYEAFTHQRSATADPTTTLLPIAGGYIDGPDGIPFAPLVLGDESPDEPMEAAPPMLDLADLVLAHWRIKADRRNSMHIACTPIPVRIGYKPPASTQSKGTQAVGPFTMIDIPDPTGKMYYLEHTGTGLEATRQEQLDLERQMGQVGMAFLASQTRQAETAEARRIDANAQNASLSAAARSLKDCIELAMEFDAQYMNERPAGFTTYLESDDHPFDAGTLAVLAGMQDKGQLTLETLLRAAVRGGFLDEDLNVEQEAAAATAQAGQRTARELQAAGARQLPPVTGAVAGA